ncbi:MAG: DUF192 domain-containing protein [Patescibacteria group bacterium]
MKWTERIVILTIFAALLGGGAWIYLTMQANHEAKLAAVKRGEYQIRPPTPEAEVDTENWRRYYPTTVPMTIGGVTVEASVAASLPDRIKGLSETPFLPDQVVKLFAFEASGEHGIWMKDMNYSLDIIWVAEQGEIVHIEEDISPDTYPTSFSSPVPAWYVIEANAGFVAKNGIVLGDEVVVVLPN